LNASRAFVTLATMVKQQAGPLAHDLLCQLASRTKQGRDTLRDIRQ